MKLSLDKMGCHCSALLLSELLGVDIFLSKSNDGGSCYLLGFAMNSNFISSLSHTSYHLSLSFFIVQAKQSKLSIAGLDHQKVCHNFLRSCAHSNTQVKSSFIPLSCLTIAAYCYCDRITSHYLILEISKVRSCLSLYNNENVYTRMILSHSYLSYHVYTCSSHPLTLDWKKFNKKYLIYTLFTVEQVHGIAATGKGTLWMKGEKI